MKTYLFVDGTNLYAAQYELFGPDKYLDFSKFINETEERVGVKFDQIYFYASYSPKEKKLTKKEKLYLKNEALFYRGVKKTAKTIFFKGYRSQSSGKEKEVDVKMAVDIVDLAHLGRYENLYLFSGDADFIQALEAAKRLKKKVSVLCLENKFMFRSLIGFPVFLLNFTGRKLKLRSIKRRPKVLKISQNNLVTQVK